MPQALKKGPKGQLLQIIGNSLALWREKATSGVLLRVLEYQKRGKPHELQTSENYQKGKNQVRETEDSGDC